jgi:hypothetical protein
MDHLPQGPSAHDLFNRIAVDPAGEPQSIGQRLMRAGGEGVGGAALPMAGMLGVAGSGLRSGVTLAEQAAEPGLPSAGGILGRLNALNPRNVASAFQPMNLQGSADRILNTMAANPLKTATARSYRAFTKAAERNAAQHIPLPPQCATADDPSQQ